MIETYLQVMIKQYYVIKGNRIILVRKCFGISWKESW